MQLSNIQKITCIILRNLFGLDLFSHQSCATGTLLLQKKIYPRKSSLNLKQLIFFMFLIKTVSCLLASALALTFVSCEKEDKTISVEKIAFNETSLTLSVGQTLTPELTITPDDATD